MPKTSLAATLLVAMICASAAHAERGHKVVVSQTIKYSDAELATDRGAADVLKRIERSARSLCRPSSHSPLDRSPTSWAVKCQSDAVARAVDTLGSPIVTAEYRRLYPQAVTLTAQR